MITILSVTSNHVGLEGILEVAHSQWKSKNYCGTSPWPSECRSRLRADQSIKKLLQSCHSMTDLFSRGRDAFQTHWDLNTIMLSHYFA